MPDTVSDKIGNTGHAIADAVKTAGEKIVEATEKTVDFVKKTAGICTEGTDVGMAGVKEHMSVIASCGTQVGVVDRVEGNSIKLRKDSTADGQHHFIPSGWIERV